MPRKKKVMKVPTISSSSLPPWKWIGVVFPESDNQLSNPMKVCDLHEVLRKFEKVSMKIEIMFGSEWWTSKIIAKSSKSIHVIIFDFVAFWGTIVKGSRDLTYRLEISF